MIKRENYLNILRNFKDKKVIKVVTGIRRCGKSTLLNLFQEELIENGIDKSQIISVNFEEGKHIDISNYIELYNLINEQLVDNKKNYVFLDEVQRVFEFEKAVDSLYVKDNVDIYITGSNAFLLSGELATLLSGRYIEINMLPLSFKEYVSYFSDNFNYERLYVDYLVNSSFPYTLLLKEKTDIALYLSSIYNSIVLKDIISHNKLSDFSLLESLIKFMFSNVGNISSINKITNSFITDGRKVNIRTVDSYIDALLGSYILYKVDRYDIKGKNYLKSSNKYYAADIGLRFNILGHKDVDKGHILENIVYLELIRRGFKVFTGKVGTSEIDFVAINSDVEEYYQVAYTVRDEFTLKRELAPLNELNNHFPKYLLTMDIEPDLSYNGIKQINVIDWLLDK